MSHVSHHIIFITCAQKSKFPAPARSQAHDANDPR